MVFAAILAAHHAWSAHSSVSGWGSHASSSAAATPAAHTQQLDGSGSGCGPTGGNCSGSIEHTTQAPDKASSSSYKLGQSPEQESTSKTEPRRGEWPGGGNKAKSGFFGENPAGQPADRGYIVHSSRDGSQQKVSYDTPSNYTGYDRPGVPHAGGLFKFFGAPAASHSASTMLGHNPDGGVHAEVRQHAFGNNHSSADAMYLPSGGPGGGGSAGGGPAGGLGLGFYGSHHTMAFGKSVTQTNALPEQVPVNVIHHAGGAGREAEFIMGVHSHSLATSTAFQHSGQVTAKSEAAFITSSNHVYGHSVVSHKPESVAFASQTKRYRVMPTGHEADMERDAGVVKGVNGQIGAFNSALTSGSAYAMTAPTSTTGTRILDRPYHPAKVNFCALHPDRCFFSPAPETQSSEGGYHSI